MSFVAKNEKNNTENSPLPQSGNCEVAIGLHKNSLRGIKLARRARSFKDDFLEKISQIRTPTNSIGRSHSPNSPRMKTLKGGHSISSSDEPTKPEHDLNYHVRQVKNALQHFKDVISRNRLEVLPGNGTVVLESIANVHTSLQSYTLNENSSAFISATTQVYLSLGKLIKLCDEVLLSDDDTNCASLNKENVAEVVDLVDSAVQNLVKLANEKISEREHVKIQTICNTLQYPVNDGASQRTSLPDIPLTPRERDILAQTQTMMKRTSHSTESILCDTSPPPKPPLPIRNIHPPPLPPKRVPKNSSASSGPTNINMGHRQSEPQTSDEYNRIDPTLLGGGLDRMSLRSKSPDDNSSLFSVSSLDSALNHSREEDELKALTADTSFNEQHNAEGIDNLIGQKCIASTEDDSFSCTPAEPVSELTTGSFKNQRNSNESGFVSMHSIRASMQSVSARTRAGLNEQNVHHQHHALSQYHQQSQSENSTSTSTFDLLSSRGGGRGGTSTSGIDDRFSKWSESEQTLTATTSQDCIDSSFISSNLSSVSMASTKFSSSERSSSFSKISEDGDQPPALPIKQRTRSTRRERHISQYDNVEGVEIFPSPSPLHSKHRSLIEPKRTLFFDSRDESPPPLPVKKKHIMAYMEMFGNCSHSTQNTADFMRHSVHTYNMNHASSEHINATSKHMHQHSRIISHSQTMSLSPIQKQSIGELPGATFPLNLSFEYLPPALPPKRQMTGSKTSSLSGTPVSSPKLPPAAMHYESVSDTNSLAAISSSSSSSTTQPQHQCQQQLQPKMKQSPQMNQSAFDTAPLMAPPVPAIRPPMAQTYSPPSTATVTAAASTTNRISPVNQYSSSDAQSASKLTATTHSIGEAIMAVADKNQYAAKSCNDMNAQTVHNRHRDENHYIPLYNDYINKNDNNKESNIVNDTTATTNDKDVVKQKNSDDSAKNNINNEISRNNCWDNNNDEVVLRNPTSNNQQASHVGNRTNSATNLVEEIDVYQYLVLRKEGEDGPDVKGGPLDSLIVHATKVQKVCDSAFGEAFITTFRTFITPMELIEKLTHRYTIFCFQINDLKQKSAKESFSLLVRVVNDLTAPDLTPNILLMLNEFVYQLVCAGQLMMAKLLRNNILEKIIIFKQQKWVPSNPILPSRAIITSPPTLLDLKSADIAEQMTLLDAELFQKIEIPEVLIWAQEQCEERSPNLTRFTEHFNKMSYWARSQILKQEDAKDREKHVIKFIKIMKHLRKINNYNSYLALLSALDSAPIRRLEWHKNITEGLKEYCALIDSSSSFRAYRQALSETNPPCIPYIGLVLQDLTFVHIGNQDYLSPGIINFSKRWQQHNIVVNMKRFKKCSAYPFKKNERIIAFFDNFENYLDEDAMWQISENIKPRVTRKTVSQA